MAPENYRYSVIIRTRNSAHTLRCVLHHLKSQTTPPSQIIIVDSGSTDHTLDLAKQFDCDIVFYPKELEFNYSKAINIGIEKAWHPWVLILSSDVVMIYHNTIELLMNSIVTNNCAMGYVNGGGERTLSGVTWPTPQTKIIDYSSFNGFNGLRNSCGMLRRDLWLGCQFDERLPSCEDEAWAVFHLRRGQKSSELTHPAMLKISDKGSLSYYERILILVYVLPPFKLIRHTLATFKRLLICLFDGEFPQASKEGREILDFIRCKIGCLEPQEKSHFEKMSKQTNKQERWIE